MQNVVTFTHGAHIKVALRASPALEPMLLTRPGVIDFLVKPPQLLDETRRRPKFLAEFTAAQFTIDQDQRRTGAIPLDLNLATQFP